MPAGNGRLAGDHQALAGHAARHLGRRRALPRASTGRDVPRQVSLRRQRPLRRGRLLLDHGPHRRRAERLRPPAEHDRDRKRAGEPSRRWPRRRRWAGPHEIKGEAVAVFVTLAAASIRREELRKELKNHVRKEIGALAVPDDIHFTIVAAEDPQRQDHAAAVARHRRRPRDRRRHHDAGRLQRAGPAADGRRMSCADASIGPACRDCRYTQVGMKPRIPTAKRLSRVAQGCRAAATLGARPQRTLEPRRGSVTPAGWAHARRSAAGVRTRWAGLPQEGERWQAPNMDKMGDVIALKLPVFPRFGAGHLFRLLSLSFRDLVPATFSVLTTGSAR